MFRLIRILVNKAAGNKETIKNNLISESIPLMLLIAFGLYYGTVRGYIKWYLALLVIVLVGFAAYTLLTKDKRMYQKASIPEVDRMTGKEFEEYLKGYFETHGYTVSLTKDSHDFGIDLIIRKRMKTGMMMKIAVQAKHYSKNVGISAVQQAIAGKAFYEANKSMVVTNRYFTASARDLAESNGVVLWDRNKLFKIKQEEH